SFTESANSSSPLSVNLSNSLNHDGYLYFHEIIDKNFCLEVYKSIKKELGEKIENKSDEDISNNDDNNNGYGFTFQEEPSSSFSMQTKNLMERFQDIVVDKLKELIKPKLICVPKGWDDTLYGRYKKKSFFT
ncbi:hypothetical protein RFI_19974, partial [Reticulomyxa filosa]